MIFHIKEIRKSLVRCFGLSDPVWIEEHPPSATDGSTELFELVVFGAFGEPSWKSLDRTAVETLVGRCV